MYSVTNLALSVDETAKRGLTEEEKLYMNNRWHHTAFKVWHTKWTLHPICNVDMSEIFIFIVLLKFSQFVHVFD